jgi:hypothetical protein
MRKAVCLYASYLFDAPGCCQCAWVVHSTRPLPPHVDVNVPGSQWCATCDGRAATSGIAAAVPLH